MGDITLKRYSRQNHGPKQGKMLWKLWWKKKGDEQTKPRKRTAEGNFKIQTKENGTRTKLRFEHERFNNVCWVTAALLLWESKQQLCCGNRTSWSRFVTPSHLWHTPQIHGEDVNVEPTQHWTNHVRSPSRKWNFSKEREEKRLDSHLNQICFWQELFGLKCYPPATTISSQTVESVLLVCSFCTCRVSCEVAFLVPREGERPRPHGAAARPRWRPEGAPRFCHRWKTPILSTSSHRSHERNPSGRVRLPQRSPQRPPQHPPRTHRFSSPRFCSTVPVSFDTWWQPDSTHRGAHYLIGLLVRGPVWPSRVREELHGFEGPAEWTSDTAHGDITGSARLTLAFGNSLLTETPSRHVTTPNRVLNLKRAVGCKV